MVEQTRVVLVTGCNQGGIGFNLCKQFASKGCKVYATAPALDDMDELRALGCELDVLDVTNTTDIGAVVSKVLREEGRIDVLVNNAGIAVAGAVTECPLEASKRLFDINYWGCVAMTQAVGPSMMQRRSGVIVNMGSASAYSAMPFHSHYSASKAGLKSLSDSLRLEMRPFNVGVLYVAPGFIHTNIYHRAAASQSIYCSKTGPFAAMYSKLHENPFENEVKHALPVEVFAKRLAAVVLRRPTPYYWRDGFLSWVSPICAWLLPTWMGDAVRGHLFQLHLLHDAVKQQQQKQKQKQKQ